jgi:hypothetical protein
LQRDAVGRFPKYALPARRARLSSRRLSNQIILEIVAGLLRLRVGHEVITTATLADRAVVILRDVGRSYARRRKFRFIDMTWN